jgi:phosphopantetheinyl transferase (holo-ACP synthase)
MVMMTTNLAKEYFSKLLNTAVDENTVIKLSSAQSTRAHAWLKSNNFNVDNLSLGSGFILHQLIGGVQSENIKVNTKSAEIKHVSSVLNSHSNIYIGIDIQSIGELFPSGLPIDPKSDIELLAMFTIKELSYAQSKGCPLQTLTGIYAAKEAAQKCTQNKINFTDMEILPDQNGKPSVNGFSISISHSQDYAVAIAVCDIKNISNDFNSPQSLIKNELLYPPKSEIASRNFILNFILPTLVSLLLLLETLRFFSLIK